MYATIIDRELSLHDGLPTLERMQEVVGGYIERLFELPSMTHSGHTVDVYVNEEGMCIEDSKIDHLRTDTHQPIAGDMIIVGYKGPKVAELSKDDLVRALSYIGRIPVTLKPSDFGF